MKHIITLRGQKLCLLMLKQTVHKITWYFKRLSEVWLKLRVSLVEWANEWLLRIVYRRHS